MRYLPLLLVFLLNFPRVMAHGLNYHEFRAVDHRVGMSAGAVYCLVQDRQGLIWMGTDRGLFSFDGYSARKHIADNNIVKDNGGVIYCAEKVDSIHFWFGADNGLLVFNTYTDRYEKAPSGMPQNIRAISRIDEHSFWIGSINGLFHYDNETGICEPIRDPLPHQAIYTILKYDENTFYFGTYNGLCRYDKRTAKFSEIHIDKSGKVSNMLILSLLADYDRNCIWVGVEGGLYSFNPLTLEPGEWKFSGNSVKSLMIDMQNCLWAGTDNGLYIYDPTSEKQKLIRHDAMNNRSLLNNVIWSLFTDKEHNIWIGTDAGVSLNIFNDQFLVRPINEITGSNEGDYIISVLHDSKDRLWLGGTNGLILIDPRVNKSIWYQQNNPSYPIPHNKVRAIYEDTDGDIWIATDGSICRFVPSSLRFIRYQVEDSTGTRNANWSYAISQDETRKLWIGTCLGGVFIADKRQLIQSEGGKYIAEKNFFTGIKNEGLSGNMIQFLAFDNEMNVWAGTYRAGVNKIDRLSRRIYWYTSKSGDFTLPSDDVTSMITGRDNYLWIALHDQVVRLDPENNSIKIIKDARLNDTYIHAMADDGRRIWLSLSSGLLFIDKNTLKLGQLDLAGNYYSSVYFDKTTNRIIAGGINEYAEFNPDQVLNELQHAQPYITSLYINDLLIQPEDSSAYAASLDRSVRFTGSLRLPHKMNNLTFEVSELTYNRQQNIQFAYMLDGLEDEWHLTPRGNNRIIYNNLPPGDYTLLVSRIGSDGNPQQHPQLMKITINQPWYLTFTARVVYLLVLVSLAVVFINYYRVWSRLRYERIEKSKTMELTAHKIDFLTNISHELKTPLSLIIGPIEKIIDQVRQVTIKEQLSDVKQNALKMGNLIHQMMEASRQEFDGFGLIVSKTDLIPFVKSVISVFEKSLGERSVQIKFAHDAPSLTIEADVMKLEIILNNILSNAAKFAPDHSVISVSAENRDDKVRITIKDQGPGIASHDLPHVFDRFYQSKHVPAQNKEGSGVGLSIVKEYTELHRGTVSIHSDHNNGTSVEVELPVKQLVEESAPRMALTMAESASDTAILPQLLIVEDNSEILAFLSKSLSGEFRILTAQNGKQGLDAAQVYQPDIIVTDIMMPVMDGLEMCSRLKENIATSMIPVVLLTARDDKNTELTGYGTGADAFISKPFEIGYLADRMHHLLRGRHLLVNKARQEAIIQPREKNVISTDEKFLATITQIIESEITNSDLNVQVLSEKSGYSQKQLYRRIKSLTGHTAVDYVRSVRLKKAAVLLSQKRFTVAEVMYMVGFTNHSYFSKRFQEKFGKPPRQYIEEYPVQNGTSSL